MNPLTKYPHLFCNGKFKIRIIGDGIHADHNFDATWLGRINRVQNINCTLIARPIEDMTDEEWNECHSDYFHPKDRFKSLKYDAEHRTLLLDDFLYLLSIGVYPFDQQHFEDGTVIDSRTI